MSSILNSILGLTHIVAGIASFIAPSSLAGAFRFKPAASTDYMIRANGIRDAALGLGIQLYGRGSPENRMAVLASAVVHAADIANVVLGYVKGEVPYEGFVTGLVLDGVLTGLSWWALQS